MKNFRDYLEESVKDHNYVIKFSQQPTEEQVQIIGKWLKRYELKSITHPEKVPIDHKDFIDIPNKDVYMMAFTIGTPCVSYILQQDLRLCTNIPEKYIVVRAANEPIERYAEYDVWSRLADKAAAQDGDTHAARLSTNREYNAAEQPPAGPLFGNEYNKNLLTYLAGVADSRPSMEVHASAPLFSWLQMEDIAPGEPMQDTSDFNAQFNTPKPTTAGDKRPVVDDAYVNSKGTMSDNAIPHVKFIKDPKTGKARQMVQPAEKN
jgi:hypothetical protein